MINVYEIIYINIIKFMVLCLYVCFILVKNVRLILWNVKDIFGMVLFKMEFSWYFLSLLWEILEDILIMFFFYIREGWYLKDFNRLKNLYIFNFFVIL